MARVWKKPHSPAPAPKPIPAPRGTCKQSWGPLWCSDTTRKASVCEPCGPHAWCAKMQGAGVTMAEQSEGCPLPQDPSEHPGPHRIQGTKSHTGATLHTRPVEALGGMLGGPRTVCDTCPLRQHTAEASGFLLRPLTFRVCWDLSWRCTLSAPDLSSVCSKMPLR